MWQEPSGEWTLKRDAATENPRTAQFWRPLLMLRLGPTFGLFSALIPSLGSQNAASILLLKNTLTGFEDWLSQLQTLTKGDKYGLELKGGFL